MAKFGENIVNFEVYEDSTRYAGMASANLPEISLLTQTISGAGIAGNIEAVTALVDAMTLTLNFRLTTEHTVALTEPRRHTIDLRIAQQVADQATGTAKIQSVKHVFVVMPKRAVSGNVAMNDANEASGEYAVYYWATFIDGVKTREIDPLNYIFYVNGVDYLADVRAALGR